VIGDKKHVSVNLTEKKCDFLKIDLNEGPLLIFAEDRGEWSEKSLTISLSWEQWEILKTMIQAETKKVVILEAV
jgi:uncharacterized protein YunC (DUF1805 family)